MILPISLSFKARDMLNYSLVKGAGELVAATNGTVTQDLTFDQLIARALKLKQMGKIKDFGLKQGPCHLKRTPPGRRRLGKYLQTNSS